MSPKSSLAAVDAPRMGDVGDFGEIGGASVRTQDRSVRDEPGAATPTVMLCAVLRGILQKMAIRRPLPNYLKMYRKRSGLSQRELAFLLGATFGSKVSRYERGERVPDFRTLLAYETVFQVPISQLFAGRHARVRTEVRARASKLHRELDGLPAHPVATQKRETLVSVLYPGGQVLDA